MPDPSELLAVARQLVEPVDDTAPTDAHLRRVASTAYYAVFHKILGAGARRFMGEGQEHQSAYALLFDRGERGPDDDLRLQFACISQFTPEEKAVARTVLESLILQHTANRFSRVNPANGVRN